jgi:hypothetical protein
LTDINLSTSAFLGARRAAMRRYFTAGEVPWLFAMEAAARRPLGGIAGPRGGRLDSTGRFALARRDADLDLICEFLRHRSLEASLEGAEPIHLSFMRAWGTCISGNAIKSPAGSFEVGPMRLISA